MINDLLEKLDNAALARGERPMTQADWDIIEQIEREAERRLQVLKGESLSAEEAIGLLAQKIVIGNKIRRERAK